MHIDRMNFSYNKFCIFKGMEYKLNLNLSNFQVGISSRYYSHMLNNLMGI